MPSPILARADALMQRRRKNNIEFEDVPVLTDTVDDIDLIDADDEIPVLLDIDTSPEAIESEVAPLLEIDEVPAILPAFESNLRDILAHELARRVEQRIVAELPRIIESTVRDFLAEQEMISTLSSSD